MKRNLAQSPKFPKFGYIGRNYQTAQIGQNQPNSAKYVNVSKKAKLNEHPK